MGPDDAKVVLVEFLDPECEACRAFHPFVKQLMADYSGKIKLVVRYAPFHGSSKYVVRVLEAARLRLRPILMTTFATVLGVLPLLVAFGAGANSRFAIGLMIAAGMLVGTLFTLFVVPAVYVLLARERGTETVASPAPGFAATH